MGRCRPGRWNVWSTRYNRFPESGHYGYDSPPKPNLGRSEWVFVWPHGRHSRATYPGEMHLFDSLIMQMQLRCVNKRDGRKWKSFTQRHRCEEIMRQFLYLGFTNIEQPRRTQQQIKYNIESSKSELHPRNGSSDGTGLAFRILLKKLLLQP